jgi:valyl-tRNA synthetase
MGVSPSKMADIVIRTENGELIENYKHIIRSLGKIDTITVDSNIDKPPHSATAVVRGMELYVPLEGLIDVGMERDRLEKRKKELTGHYESAEKTLSNKEFIDKAPESVVDSKKKKLNEMKIELEKLISNLEMLN